MEQGFPECGKELLQGLLAARHLEKTIWELPESSFKVSSGRLWLQGTECPQREEPFAATLLVTMWDVFYFKPWVCSSSSGMALGEWL